MRLLYDNKFLTSTYLVSSEDPNYPEENLISTLLAKTYRSTATSTIIKISTTITASYCVLLNHNFTDTATVTLQGNDTDSWGSPSFEQNLNIRSKTCILNFNEATYNYWRLVITDDDSSADGYIEIGFIYLGTYFQMPGMRLDQTISNNVKTNKSETYSGQTYSEKLFSFRELNVNFPLLTHTDRANLSTVWEANQGASPVIALLWANELDKEEPFYGYLDQDAMEFKRLEKSDPTFSWSTKLKLKESF